MSARCDCYGEMFPDFTRLAGFGGFEHLKLEAMGFKKGESPVTPEQVRAVADRGAALLAV